MSNSGKVVMWMVAVLAQRQSSSQIRTTYVRLKNSLWQLETARGSIYNTAHCYNCWLNVCSLTALLCRCLLRKSQSRAHHAAGWEQVHGQRREVTCKPGLSETTSAGELTRVLIPTTQLNTSYWARLFQCGWMEFLSTFFSMINAGWKRGQKDCLLRATSISSEDSPSEFPDLSTISPVCCFPDRINVNLSEEKSLIFKINI